MLRKMMFGGAVMMLASVALADNYTFDPTHTYPNFTVNHLGFSTMYGRFNETTGTMTMDRAKGTGSVNIVIKAASIDTGMGKRDDHLRSPDFFNVKEFPELTFKSTKVTFKGDKAATVDGDLTIMGVTKKVTLDVPAINCGTHPFNNKQVCGFDATTSIKRSDFGMKYGLPAIGDDIKIFIEAEAVKD